MENCTITSVWPIGLEARFAGAEGVCAIYHTVGFVPVNTHCPVTAAVAQHVVCMHTNVRHAFTLRVIQKTLCQ